MGIVYLICNSENETYKVGITKTSTDKRLKELNTGNSIDLFLVTSYDSSHYKHIEKTFHKQYEKYRENREWFKLPLDIITNFEQICSKIEETHIFLLENNEIYSNKFKK